MDKVLFNLKKCSKFTLENLENPAGMFFFKVGTTHPILKISATIVVIIKIQNQLIPNLIFIFRID